MADGASWTPSLILVVVPGAVTARLIQRLSYTLSLLQSYSPPLFMKSNFFPVSTLFPPYLQLLHQQQH